MKGDMPINKEAEAISLTAYQLLMGYLIPKFGLQLSKSISKIKVKRTNKN